MYLWVGSKATSWKKTTCLVKTATSTPVNGEGALRHWAILTTCVKHMWGNWGGKGRGEERDHKPGEMTKTRILITAALACPPPPHHHSGDLDSFPSLAPQCFDYVKSGAATRTLLLAPLHLTSSKELGESLAKSHWAAFNSAHWGPRVLGCLRSYPLT